MSGVLGYGAKKSLTGILLTADRRDIEVAGEKIPSNHSCLLCLAQK